MPAFLLQTSYDVIIKNILDCVSMVVEKLLKKACVEEMNASEKQGDEYKNYLTVSGDGTWKKRGFTSLFGVTSLIGYYSGKIIDLFVKSSYCNNVSLGNLKKILLNIKNGGMSIKKYVLLIMRGHQEKWKLML